MRIWASLAALGLSLGSLAGLVRARRAVAGHGLLDAGLARLWRELVRAELLSVALPAALLGLALAAVWTLLGRLGIGRSARTAGAACATLLAAAAAGLTWLLRGGAGAGPGRLGRALVDAPRWAVPATRAALILTMLGLIAWLVRWWYPRLRSAADTGRGWARLGGALTSRWVLGAGGLAALGLGALELACRLDRSARSDGPNLVLVTVDTLRADHLGCYGSARPTSPHVDALAAGGVRFEQAMSQAPWTLPAMASLHTSLYPSEHGADRGNRRLSQRFTTLAEVLRDGGYRTLGVVSHLFVSARFGFEQGFERFDERAVLGHQGVSSELLTRTALELVGAAPPEPFFLWVHYFDPHYTYVGHDAFDFADPASQGLAERIDFEFLERETAALSEAQVGQVIALYDEEIAYTDAAIGALAAGLAGLDLARPTVTALTADHGELFRERGRFGHGREVYAELVHVPLLVHGPAELVGPPRTVSAPVETASLPRTLARLAGLDGDHFGGLDLLGPEAASGAAPAFFEGGYASGDDWRKLGVLSADGWKLIWNLDQGTRELYQLGDDPHERTDRSADPSAAEAAARLGELLARFGRGFSGPGEEVDLDRSELEHLRDLGYVE